MSAPKRIQELVKKFSDNFEYYQAIDYKEQELRHEFLNPFFQELGWDMENTAGKGADRDVHYEKRVKGKAPDFGFYLDGKLRFFVEAKNPTKNVCNDPLAASQLRTYGWSSKIPRSVLTDFEEFSIYDTTARPKQNDSARVARLDCIHYKEYIERWDEIVGLFSREAVIAGSLEKLSKKRAKEAVDAGLLEDISKWRELLAKNIALRNAGLTEEQVNRLVQDTLDRLIFLRICEDRGIEPEERLREAVDGEGLYGRLFKIFKKAEQRYDSGLFDLKPLAADLVVDDKTISEIISELYFPKSPYKFDAIPAEILGQVYEQFLGKVIRLTAGHHAKVEDKPEVRKAGGVYYTPTYIVEYIVENTVGKLIEGKSPKEIATLSVLDPACGSGSFLIGAYQYLMDWYRDWYAEHDAKKHVKNKLIYHDADGVWQLTLAERTRILLAHIYGVDIDRQAVEVAKLSLMLKALELSEQQSLFNDRILPVLSSNIKCGNSLIGTDYFAGQMMMDPAEMARINSFDWDGADGFPEIMKRGGFDAVIGNPPWGALLTAPELEYLKRKNRDIIVRMIDSFMFFVRQSNGKLNTHGLLGMILPDVILYQTDNQKLREHMLRRYKIHCVINLGNVFDKVTRPACILILERGQARSNLLQVADLSELSKTDKPLQIGNKTNFVRLEQEKIFDVPGSLFITSNLAEYIIWAKVKVSPNQKLKDIVDEDGIQRGVSPDLKDAFLVESKIAERYRLEPDKLRKVLTGGKQVKRYCISYPDLLLIYTKRGENFRELPNICAYIDQYKDRITCKEVQLQKHPLYALHRARKEKIFLKKQKLFGVITEDQIILALDQRQTFATDGLYVFGVRETINLKFVMGILNSKLFVSVYRLLTLESGRVLAQVKPTVLAQLPIRSLDLSDPVEKSLHEQMVRLVDQMMGLLQQLAEVESSQAKTVLQRKIDATDRQIDQLVYKLYGLTEDEIKIVEEGTK
ncbi:MAG: N-6 DNA methylase [Candidatus Uhrbacteria bacterium]